MTMRTHAAVARGPRAVIRLAVVLAPVVMGAAPPAENVSAEAAAAFGILDAAPRDGVLTGRERDAVVAYDSDADGQVTPEEFARAYIVKQPVTWQRHEFEREGFSCEMPIPPKPLALNAAAYRLQVVADVPEPRVVLVARSRDIPKRFASKPAAFFDSIAERLERGGAKVLARHKADLGLHRGDIVEIEWGDGRIELVRAVIRGPTVYELDAIVAPGVGPPGRAMAERFLASLELVR